MGLPLDPATGAILVSGAVGGGGAGTEYTEGAVDTTITGTAILFEDAGDTLRVPSAANRLPVSLPAGGTGLTDTELRASAVPVSGPLTDAQLRALAVPVSLATGIDVIDRAARLLGHVTIDNASLAVTGTFWQATQPVSLAAAVDVSDRVGRLLGHVTVDSAPSTAVTGPLTDAQLRAAAVPVTIPTPTPVTDNAGSLTVDAPVATPAFVRLSDGAAPITALPVTDNAGSLTVDDGAGSLTVDGVFFQATQPVSLATNTPDVTDRAARELGRARIWDGVDEATVLPVRTQPATTEKALNVMELPTRLATFATVTPDISPAITLGVKELLKIFNNSAVDVYIVEIWLSIIVSAASTTGGRTTARVSTITTAPTGGTELGKAAVGGSGAAAITNTMSVPTGGGTLGTTFIRREMEVLSTPVNTRINEPLFQASTVGSGLVLRAAGAAGLSVDCERVAAHTALADTWTVGIRWLEL